MSPLRFFSKQPIALSASLALTSWCAAQPAANQKVANEPAIAGASVSAPQTVSPVVVSGVRPSPAPLSLDDSAATASNLGLSLRELPLSVTVIDRDSMQQQGQRSALEAVASTVGVIGGNLPGSNPRYAMRGFTDNNVTLLRDGIRQNTIAQSSRPVDSFVLDRIEILKGPSSMMHGEGAVAGAVNYVSRAPSFTGDSEILAGAGGFGAWRVGATLSQPSVSGALAYRISAAALASGGRYLPRSNGRIESFAFALEGKLSSTLRAGFAIDTQREDIDTWFGLPVIYDQSINTITGAPRASGVANMATDRLVNARIDPSTRRYNYNLSDSFNRGENTFARASLAWQVNSGLSANLNAYQALHALDWRNSENYVWNPTTRLVQRDLFYIYRDDALVGLRADLRGKFALSGARTAQFALGIDAQRNQLERGTRAAGALPASVFNVALNNPDSGATPAQFQNYVPQADAKVNSVSPFAEFAVDLFSGVKAIGGVRYDDIAVRRVDRINAAASANQDYAPVTGRFGLTWAFRPATSLYANWASSADPVQQFVSINETQAALTLQRGRQFEIGMKHTSAGKSLDFTAAAYQIEKRNLLTTSIVNGVSTSQAVGGQSSRGIELAAAWHPHQTVRIGANAAWTDAAFDDFSEVIANPRAPAPGQPATVQVQRAGNTPSNIPKVSANAFVQWRFMPNLAAGLTVQHVGEREANTANLVQLPAYTVLGASLDYTWGAWTVSARARNLTNQTYADWSINQGLQQRLGDPRSFELTLHARF